MKGFHIVSVKGNLTEKGDGFLPYFFQDLDWKVELKESIFITFSSDIEFDYEIEDYEDIYDEFVSIVEVDYYKRTFTILGKNNYIGAGSFILIKN